MNDMTEAVKELKRQYYREYRAKNKDKTREINKRYWERKAKKAREKDDQ